MDDLLKRSALAYQALMPYRYHFALGWKGQLRRISLCFPEAAYHHLAGFHKAGFEALANKKRSLQTVISGRVAHVHFQAAGIALEDRWEGICCLQTLIEANRIVFHYRGHEQPGSMLKGDYLMTDGRMAFFIAGDAPESIFAHQGRHYEQGCPRFVTLEIRREDLTNGEQIAIFRSPSYHE